MASVLQFPLNHRVKPPITPGGYRLLCECQHCKDFAEAERKGGRHLNFWLLDFNDDDNPAPAA